VEHVGGRVSFSNTVEGGAIRMESLVEIGSSLYVDSPGAEPAVIELPRLVHVGTEVSILGHVAVSLPLLESIGGLSADMMNTGAFELPQLKSVEGPLRLFATTATTISFPQLERVRLGLSIESNAELTALDLPLLSHVGAELRVAYNPRLPACEVEALVERLGEEVGVVTISGNDETATCE
jgi:hypothetical protein